MLVVNHGRHAGLLLRAGDVPAGAWPALADFPDADYLEVGWGDRAYYMAADPGAWLGLKAVAWPTLGVLHVVGIDTAPERFFPGAEILEIGVAPAGCSACSRICARATNSTARGARSRWARACTATVASAPRASKFHLFKTCKVWVAPALQAAGVQVTPALTLTAERLMAQLRPLAKVRP